MRVDPDGKRCFKADDTTDLSYIYVQAEKTSVIQHTREDGYLVEDKPSCT